MRYSRVFIPQDVKHILKRAMDNQLIDPEQARELMGKEGWAEDIEYKCPRCQIVKVFGIPLSNEERLELGKLRKASLKIPVHEWLENEILAKKLKDLGYW